MSYAAAGSMVVLILRYFVCLILGPGKPGKRPLSSRVNWQAGWWQTTSELTISELTGPLAGRLVANDLRARGPTESSRANWQAGWRQTTSELAGRHKTRYTENHRIPKITGLELAGRLANDLRAREPKSSRAQS